jgi:tetratricopeptide (TPR) repeat protein
LITVYGHLGDAELLRGRADEAAAYWQKALDAAEVWFGKNPSDASKLVLGNSYRRASRGAQLNGVLDKAQEHARKAIEIHEALAAAQPSSTSRQRELLNSYERLAFVAGDPDGLNLGDLPTAFAYNNKVVAIATSLAEVDPNNRMAKSDLVIARLSNCYLVPDDDPQRVLKECQASLDSDRQNVFAGVHEGVASRMGPALFRLGKRAEAVQTMENAIELLKGSSRRFPWRVDLKRSLVRIHTRFAGILLEMKERDRAIGIYRTGVAIGEEAVPKHPRDSVLRRDLADLYAALGRCYESFDASQAAQWYRKDLEIWSEWPRVATSTNFDQGRRAAALRNIARINP